MSRIYPTIKSSTCLKTLFAIVMLFCFSASFAQMPFDAQKLSDAKLRRINRRDSLMDKKRFGRAVTELGIDEVFTWSLDRYIRNADYARISFSTVWDHLNPGSWEFDNDPFQTNQFGHPYHGSYYFNSFRTNGYSFWQSVPAPFIGSYIWETAAENQNPAPNDFVNTSFGGVILGEMTYRISNKIVNNRTRGFKRQVAEVAALVINPTFGLNRILDGKWGKVGRNSDERDSSKIALGLDGGLRRFGANDSKGKFGWYGHLSLLYGTPYEHYKKAFSNFVVNAEVGQDDSSKVNVVSVYGSLTGWELRADSSMQHLAILSANYDYIHNEAFSYGAQSVKMNLFSKFNVTEKIKLATSLGVGPVLLGAVPDKYFYKGRSYDYGSGAAVNAGGKLAFGKHFSYDLSYRGGWIKTISGNDGHYFLHTVSTELCYMYNKNFGLAAETGYFTLKGHYDEYPEANSRYPYARLSFRYNVNIQ